MTESVLPAQGFDSAPYGFDAPASRADFKLRPEDFIVEEVLGFDPSGEGEHLFLLLQTDDQNTRYTVKLLARYFGVAQRQVSYSGLKDRRGLTSQWFSIHLPGQNPIPQAEQLAEQGIRLLQYGRHHRKLRIGTHKANRFRIVLRNLENGNDLERRFDQIQAVGVPNYFGPQRFGLHGGNLEEALDWAQRRELPVEKAVRSRVLSTLRSWVFNGSLGARVQLGSWNTWIRDDPILLDGTQSFFFEQSWSEPLQQRFAMGDIHLGGWLPGAESEGLPDDVKALFQLAGMKREPRPLRLLPRCALMTLNGDSLHVQFELPKGAFATAVLRELLYFESRTPES